MHPVLFELFGFRFYAFGAIIALACGLGTFWILRRARERGENDETYLEGMFWLIIMSFLGARICYLIFFPEQFWADPVGSTLSQGGLVWYGGMIAFILTLVIFARIKRLSFSKFGDIVAPPAALGLAIGRIGCLMAGCCYGAPCNLPWGIQYPSGHFTHPHTVHPTQLYESLSLLPVIALLLWIEKNKKPAEGVTGWLFVVLYGVIRFVVEYFRGDRLVWIEALNLSASQVISLVGIGLGLGVIVFLNTRKGPSPAGSHT